MSETEEFLHAAHTGLASGTDQHFCILEKKTGGFLGIFGIHQCLTPCIETGLWLRADRHHQGFGAQAIEAVLSFLTARYTCNCLVYPVAADNGPSRALAEKFGFVLFREYDKPKGKNELLHILEYRKYAAAQRCSPDQAG
ncbi:hypothetical protein C7T94_06190 [Pedobacter yulinensis]|uniref:N-acetyltransferase domain-containing protein n=1 Tax=Pedobacter yulinensis TaxID=2126353 RepID=A0A2T3HPD3_9SPHI|nr:GNAT family N-acetyltransferase [Pedobacter yulinensis]PST84302.1 hypothetical protein C7T94_06190 [Pedobacter yulinensis]